MASSGNFMTLNPLKYKASSYTTSTIQNQGMKLGEGTGNAAQFNIGFKKGDGKFYWEFHLSDTGGSHHFGVCLDDADLNNNSTGKAIIGHDGEQRRLVPSSSTSNSTVTSTSTTSTNFSNGDIIGVAFDFTNSTAKFYKNNSEQADFSWSGANDGTTYYPYVYCNHGVVFINSGQDSSFSGTKSTGSATAADENGFGDFYYTPPSGYLAACSANLPISSDIDPGETDDGYPAKNFNVVTYSGTQTDGRAVNGVGFKPDLVWIKQRAGSGNPGILTDSSRGATKRIESYANIAEATDTDGLQSFTADGFTLGTNDKYNWTSTWTYVAWCWKANGGVTSTNTDGTITSTVQANTAAGFSIMLWSGDNSQNATIGHGLGGTPDVWMVKSRSSTNNWRVGLSTTNPSAFASLSGDHTAVKLNNNDAAGDIWRTEGNFTPTSTTCNTPNNGNSAAFFTTSGENFVGYCWRSIDGFSKFGVYTGNGNVDGPYIYMGFRPRLFVQKRLDSTGSWRVWDSERHPLNPLDAILRWEDNGQEDTANGQVDFLSNGVKIRMTYNEMNADGGTYLYMAWADVPAKYNNSFL